MRSRAFQEGGVASKELEAFLLRRPKVSLFERQDDHDWRHIKALADGLDHPPVSPRTGASRAFHFAVKYGFTDVLKLLLLNGRVHMYKRVLVEWCNKKKYNSESKAILRMWLDLTDARRVAIHLNGWAYIDVPTKWTTQNHSQFPPHLRTWVAAVALAWQLPLVPFNRKPGDILILVVILCHAQMNLH